MNPDPSGPLVIVLALLVLHAFCVGYEEALCVLSDSKLRRESEEGDLKAKKAWKLYENRERVITTLRMVRYGACFLIAALCAVHFIFPAVQEKNTPQLWMAIVGLAFLALVFGDVLPRLAAARHGDDTIKRAVGFLQLISVLFYPVAWLSHVLAKITLYLFGVKLHDTAEEVTEEDIRQLVETGGETGAIEEGEKEMIENIFEFNKQSAENVMTHRTDVAAICVEDSGEEVLQTILTTGYSRFPVYGKDIDDIVGTINTRDFLLSRQENAATTVRDLLRKAYFVPEYVQADVLFRDMQKQKVHMAVVVDEYGGMSGIVTMEDLLEEIVGNIYDEFDEQGEAEITQLGDNLWRIAGTATLEDISEALSVDLPTEEDYDTLGGLVFNQLTTIPQDGSCPQVDAAGLHIEVEKLEEHRVETALVSILPPNSEEEEGEPNNE